MNAASATLALVSALAAGAPAAPPPAAPAPATASAPPAAPAPATAPARPAAPAPAAALVVVVGAGGAPEYAARFREAAEHWRKAGTRAGATVTVIGLGAPAAGDDRGAVQAALATAARATGGPLWLVFVGHGTYDGRAARFNLRGPDVSGPELAQWLKPLRRPLIFVHGASASAPFIKAVTGPGRIVVTATKSGAEQQATRFGLVMAQAIAEARADLDRDGAVSLLEAFLYAGKRVEASYAEEGLLATEHALLEDNGDGLGTPASSFRGLAAVQPGAGDAARDGDRARQVTLIPGAAEPDLDPAARRRRDDLELAVAELRERRQRDKLSDAVYYARLETLLLELARIYHRQRQPAQQHQPPAQSPPLPASRPQSRGNNTSASTP